LLKHKPIVKKNKTNKQQTGKKLNAIKKEIALLVCQNHEHVIRYYCTVRIHLHDVS